MAMGGGWVIDLDVRKFFDRVDHGLLREVLRRRVRDGVLVRLIGKWLNAGVLEEGQWRQPGGAPAGRGDLADARQHFPPRGAGYVVRGQCPAPVAR
ncbi:hypothetical protein [Aquisalimonas sp. 2447]|nr:hypothetical protein [Aquisalimonas sp. 2447]